MFLGSQCLLRTYYLPNPRKFTTKRNTCAHSRVPSPGLHLDHTKEQISSEFRVSQCPATEATCRYMIICGHRGWGWEDAITCQ